MGHHEKEERLNHLKEYLKNRQHKNTENALPNAVNFRLPPIPIGRRQVGSKSARRALDNSSSAIMMNKVRVDN